MRSISQHDSLYAPPSTADAPLIGDLIKWGDVSRTGHLKGSSNIDIYWATGLRPERGGRPELNEEVHLIASPMAARKELRKSRASSSSRAPAGPASSRGRPGRHGDPEQNIFQRLTDSATYPTAHKVRMGEGNQRYNAVSHKSKARRQHGGLPGEHISASRSGGGGGLGAGQQSRLSMWASLPTRTAADRERTNAVRQRSATRDWNSEQQRMRSQQRLSGDAMDTLRPGWKKASKNHQQQQQQQQQQQRKKKKRHSMLHDAIWGRVKAAVRGSGVGPAPPERPLCPDLRNDIRSFPGMSYLTMVSAPVYRSGWAQLATSGDRGGKEQEAGQNKAGSRDYGDDGGSDDVTISNMSQKCCEFFVS